MNMNYQQRQAIAKTREKINEIRNLLDDVMYRSEPIDDVTYMKIRESYDLICQAGDMLP